MSNHVKFSFLTGDVSWKEYGVKWVSQKLNNGDWDYWLVIDFMNWEECTGELCQGMRYHVDISAVSPTAAGMENLTKALESCGLTFNETSSQEGHDLVWVEALHSYGIKSHLWQQDGNNANKLMHEARQQAQVCEGMFGFYMDGPKNKIGTTGWEAISGDLHSGMARTILSGSTTGRILAKMHGVDPEELRKAVNAEPGCDPDHTSTSG